jgi:thiamine-monophosphate kinase
MSDASAPAADRAPQGERELIRRIRALFHEPTVASPDPSDEPPRDAGSATGAPPIPFGDDMAQLCATDGVLWTLDTIMDGVDFDGARHTPYEIGRKAMAVNLSDCAAMAVAPASALCGLILNGRLSLNQALDLVRGARDLGLEFACPIVGGDVNSWAHPLCITMAVAGSPEPGRRAVPRGGAQPGDVVYVSGKLGGSILGRHLSFVPRVGLALAMNRVLDVHAMIDISDGLSVDLAHILEASGRGALLERRALEGAIHADAQRLAAQDGRSALEHALHDGEDFELLVVLPPDEATQARAAGEFGLLAIGRIVETPGLHCREADGRETAVQPRGWEHFR